MSETITVTVEDTPTQFVNILQEAQQHVVIEEAVQAVVEIAAEGLPGIPGAPGAPGPPGPPGESPDQDVPDLTLIFENKVV